MKPHLTWLSHSPRGVRMRAESLNSLSRVVMPAALTVVVCCGVCWGQGEDQVQPASSNVDGAKYPRIHSDRRVDFQVIAPAAQKVQVQIAGATLDMVKRDDGTWTATSVPQVPGFHYYSIVVDGAVVADPASKTYFGIAREASAVEIPEKGVDFYDVKNVPHGETREHWYF